MELLPGKTITNIKKKIMDLKKMYSHELFMQKQMAEAMESVKSTNGEGRRKRNRVPAEV